MERRISRPQLYSRRGILILGQGMLAIGLPFEAAVAQSPAQKIVSEAAQQVINADRSQIERAITAELGKGDLIAKGITLYKINFRMGTPNFRFVTQTDFDCRLTENYMYCKSTTPSRIGSFGDPAFEIHFDLAVTGDLMAAPGSKPHVERVVVSVPRIKVKPRNLTGGVVTTVVNFFQKTERGKETIQRAVDKYLRRDVTDEVNKRLQQL